MPNIQWYHGLSHENFLSFTVWPLHVYVPLCVCLYMLMLLSSHTSHYYPLWRLANLSIPGEKELWKQWHIKVRTSQKTIWWNLHFKNEMNIDMASVPDSDRRLPLVMKVQHLTAIMLEIEIRYGKSRQFAERLGQEEFLIASRLFSISSWRGRSPCCLSS